MYLISFVPDYPSIYYISLSNDGLKYGNDIQLEFVKRTCSGSTPILCANNECATDYLSCIQPPNGCNISAPFLCKVDGVETCVKSQTDCDCPTGYIKCDYMKYCVPEDREDMCPLFLEFKCPKRGAERQADGICRSEGGRPPSQLVCPYGKVLCADLTCKDNYDECPRSDILTKKVRCVDQTQTDSNSLCPSTITCTNPDYVVCPDTKCVEMKSCVDLCLNAQLIILIFVLRIFVLQNLNFVVNVSLVLNLIHYVKITFAEKTVMLKNFNDYFCSLLSY